MGSCYLVIVFLQLFDRNLLKFHFEGMTFGSGNPSISCNSSSINFFRCLWFCLYFYKDRVRAVV
jgi:hypothetical protein